MKKSFFITLLLVAVQSNSFAKSPYRYTLNPDNAEQVLATLAGRPRLMETQWLGIVGTLRDETYTIARGDSLWNISSRLLNNPFLWRKLWEENPTLTNPHELVIGDTLYYYRVESPREPASEGDKDKDKDKAIPIIKLTKASLAAMDLDSDSFANRDIKNRTVVRLMVLPQDDDQMVGEISGAYSVGDLINPSAVFYMAEYEDGDDIKEGQKFTILHYEREIKDTSVDESPVLGDLYSVVGTAQIVEKGEKFWKMELAEMFGGVQRGDLVIPYQDPVKWTTSTEPPNKMQARILAGEDPNYGLLGQNQLVLLSKGQKDGMKEGFLFRVWHDTDPQTEKKDGVEPISKGEVRVIFVGENSSVAVVLKNNLPLEIGDTVVPCQVFTNLPPPPQRDYNAIEID